MRCHQISAGNTNRAGFNSPAHQGCTPDELARTSCRRSKCRPSNGARICPVPKLRPGDGGVSIKKFIVRKPLLTSEREDSGMQSLGKDTRPTSDVLLVGLEWTCRAVSDPSHESG